MIFNALTRVFGTRRMTRNPMGLHQQSQFPDFGRKQAFASIAAASHHLFLV